MPASPETLAGLHVLTVDDNEVNRRVIQEQVSAWGMRNGSYATGEEALQAIHEAERAGDPFQMVIADYQMPGMDGAVLAAKLKAEPGLSNIAFVLLTSVGHWKESRGATAVDACLQKPVRQAKLQNTLASVWAQVANRRAAAALKTPPAVPVTVRPSAKTESISLATLAARTEGDGGPSRQRALLVEDNPVNQKVAVLQLAKLGIDADVASDGREALQMATMRSYCLILMDCQMPEMNGYEATAEIRRTEGPNQHVPIVAMTADAINGARERCLTAGMDDFVSKPVNPEMLRRAVQEALALKEKPVAALP